MMLINYKLKGNSQVATDVGSRFEPWAVADRQFWAVGGGRPAVLGRGRWLALRIALLWQPVLSEIPDFAQNFL